MYNPNGERRPLLALEASLVRARDVMGALVRAVAEGDPMIAVEAAAGLRQCLLEASGWLDAAVAERGQPESRLEESLLRATDDMLTLLRRTPHTMNATTHAWGLPQGRPLLDDSRSREISSYDSRGRCLDGVWLSHLHIAHSRFITSMRSAIFAHVVVDDCDFTYSRLDGSSWECAAIRGSSLRLCSLVDAAFESTVFRRCDLRGADLGVTHLSRAPFDVTFIECDLRGATWHGRDTSRTMQVGCAIDDAVELQAEPHPFAGLPKVFS